MKSPNQNINTILSENIHTPQKVREKKIALTTTDSLFSILYRSKIESRSFPLLFCFLIFRLIRVCVYDGAHSLERTF